MPIIEKSDFKKNVTQALVLVPTRELALQVSREAQRLSEGTDLRTAVVYGGVGYGTQLEAFRSGAHLVVGTPGRILDHLLKNNLFWIIYGYWFSMKPTGCCRWVFIRIW